MAWRGLIRALEDQYIRAYIDLLSLVTLLGESPAPQGRHAAGQLRRALGAGQAGVYVRVLPGIPVALADPFFQLALSRAAALRVVRPRVASHQ